MDWLINQAVGMKGENDSVGVLLNKKYLNLQEPQIWN